MKRLFYRGCCDPVLMVVFTFAWLLAKAVGREHEIEDLIDRLRKGELNG